MTAGGPGQKLGGPGPPGPIAGYDPGTVAVFYSCPLQIPVELKDYVTHNRLQNYSLLQRLLLHYTT